jgi:DNA-3-methyladenine glycosylase I
MAETIVSRCKWVSGDPLYVEYHDKEWGVPVHDDRKHFEFLILEGAQAGLSWLTILRRREGYHNAFAEFDAQTVARFEEDDVERLMSDTGIIRNRLKIKAAVKNAQAFLKIQDEFESFYAYIWGFVGGKPVFNHPKDFTDVPTTSVLSDTVSRDLKKRGMSFVGSKIIYAHLQATGIINDHIRGCFRYNEVVGSR